MDTLVYVGVGAVVGAVMGSGTGFAVGKYKQHTKSKQELMLSLIKDEDETQRRKSEEQATNQPVEATPAAADTTSVASTVKDDKTLVVAPTAAAEVVEEKPIAVAKPIDPKHEVFGVKTTYFSSTTEFFTPMSRFETFLQFAEEREAFRRAVEHVDHLLGMDTLLHGRNPLSVATMPTIAQSARNKALRLLNEIAKFSNNRRPSPTKEKDMLQIIDEIRQDMDDIIGSMHKTVAATPFVSK